MKKLIVLLLLLVQCNYLFAVDVKTNRQTTRVSEDKVKFDWRKSMSVKPQNYSVLGDPGYAAAFGLDCYVSGGVKRYAIKLNFQYSHLEFPAIIHMGSLLAFRTTDNQYIRLKPALVQSETKYVVLPIGHNETMSCAYYPISEEDLQKVCKGINMFGFEYMRFDGNQVGYDKIEFTGNKFSKEFSKFYEKVSKKESKLKDRNENVDQSIKNFLGYDPGAVILLYHGYRFPLFLYERYLHYTGEKSGSDAYESYQAQVDDVQTIYNSELLNAVSESVQKQTASFNSQFSAAIAQTQNNFQQLAVNIQKINEQKAALKQAQKAKQEADYMAMLERQKQIREEDEAKWLQEYARTNSGYNGMDDRNRGAQRQMETSDMAQYQAMQMSDATYGTAATNQALAQQRQYDAEQRQQYQINQTRALDNNLGTTVNAVTENGSPIQIKVNNGVVTAYSTSQNNYSNTGPNWKTVNVSASRTTDSRYGYEANIGIGKVYWGEHSSLIQSNVEGTAINAITANGETIQLRVQDETIIAYRKNGSQPWNTRIVTAKRTNVTYDGEQIASRFKYKADLPGIGTVYF